MEPFDSNGLPNEGWFPPPGGWKPRTHYVVNVVIRVTQHRIAHRAILYTGQLNADGKPWLDSVVWSKDYHSEVRPVGGLLMRLHHLSYVCEIGEMNSAGVCK